MIQEYSIGNKYIIIMQQVVQTNDPQIVNRIEIGEIIAETKSYLIIKTLATKRYVKKKLIVKLIDISSVGDLYTQRFIDKLEECLI